MDKGMEDAVFNPYGQYNIQNTAKKQKKKVTETMAHGYSSESTQREPSIEY